LAPTSAVTPGPIASASTSSTRRPPRVTTTSSNVMVALPAISVLYV
jgi:hypothetical protein